MDGKHVPSPKWRAVKGARKCNAATEITDAATLTITWDTAAEVRAPPARARAARSVPRLLNCLAFAARPSRTRPT